MAGALADGTERVPEPCPTTTTQHGLRQAQRAVGKGLTLPEPAKSKQSVPAGTCVKTSALRGVPAGTPGRPSVPADPHRPAGPSAPSLLAVGEGHDGLDDVEVPRQDLPAGYDRRPAFPDLAAFRKALGSALAQQLARQPRTFALNDLDKTDKTEDVHFSRVGADYVIDLLGKTGEALPEKCGNCGAPRTEFALVEED